MPSGLSPKDARSSFTEDAIEIDRNRLYFVSFPEGSTPSLPGAAAVPAQKGEVDQEYGRVQFCGTEEYVCQHFFADFGPPHLGHVYAFCRKLGRLLQQHKPVQGHKEEDSKNDDGGAVMPVYVYCTDHPHQRSNAAMLVLAYAVRCSRSGCKIPREHSHFDPYPILTVCCQESPAPLDVKRYVPNRALGGRVWRLFATDPRFCFVYLGQSVSNFGFDFVEF